MFCVKKAFQEAGYKVDLPGSVSRHQLPEICERLGVALIGYLETKEEHFDPKKIEKIKHEIQQVPINSPVIAIYTTDRATCEGHAEYFQEFRQVPPEKTNGMIIHELRHK